MDTERRSWQPKVEGVVLPEHWVPQMAERLDKERAELLAMDEPDAIRRVVKARHGSPGRVQGPGEDEAVGHVFARHTLAQTMPAWEKRRFATYVHGRPFIVRRMFLSVRSSSVDPMHGASLTPHGSTS